MKPTEQTCDLQRIDAYLEERLSDALAGEFERHLCECDRCRRELEKRSAEPEVWREFVALLGRSSSPQIGIGSHRWYEDEGSDFGEQASQERRNSRLERYVSSVLESLAPTDDPAMLGRVGDYEISGVVGVGGMGAVLKGFDKSLRRVVAIKVMAPHLAHSGSARTRFQREARAAAAITHDNVIDIYAVSEAAGLPYLVMPYARGPSLQKRIDEGGPLGVVEVVRIGRQIAAGLSAAHEQGLVHRDIKPANILLSDGIERLWITDFGVARAMDDASMTQTGVIAGTPQYMSPEQARGESVDHRSDLFSLGSVLYTACTGRPPFRSEAAYGILRRITDSEPRPIREINSEIPEWLCVIIGRLLAKHPADRFESAGEVVDLLDGCLSHLQQPHQVELPASLRSQGMIEDPRRLIAGVSNRSEPQVQPVQPPRQFFSKRGLIMIGSIFLAGLLGVLSMQWTKPTDISGHWTGESWQHISLVSVDEASDWYSGTFLDATGRTGALRLEWSRWQRRYNGRWKVGEAESGQITLRASENGMLRGALSVDPESPLEPEVPRLLEFAWRPASDEAQQGFASRMAESKSSRQEVDRPSPFRTASIQSPTQGIIVRIAKGIQLNRRVEAGDFIAEIELAESTVSSLQEQLAILRRKSEAGKTRVYSLERERGAAREICMAIEEQIKNLESAKQQNSSAVDNGLETASTPIQVQNHLDTAVVALRKAEADALKLDSERNLALEDIALCDREIVKLEVKIGQVSRLQILAPVAGRVTSVNALVEGNTVKEGDVICVLEQEPVQTLPLGDDVVEAGSSLTPAADTVPNDPTSVARPSSPLQGLSAMRPASELAKRLRESRHRLARIDSAIEEQKAKRSQAEIKLLSLRERRGQAKEDGLANNLLDVGVAQSESIIQAIENEIEHSQAEKRLVGVELAEAEHEHQYILEILQTQLSAAQGQWELEKTSRERMEATRKQGHTSDMELRQAEQAVAMAESDLRQLKLLYEFYSRIGKNNEEPKSEER